MANAIYSKAKESMLQAGINLSSGTVKAALVDTGTYTYSSSHQYYSSVSSGAVATTTLSSKTFTDGLFDSADPTWSSVSGNSAEAIVLYVDTGNPATSPLICYRDTGVTGLPVTPNGGDISCATASGWFQL